MEFERAKALMLDGLRDGQTLAKDIAELFLGKHALTTASAIAILSDYHRRRFPNEWGVAVSVQEAIGDEAWEKAQAEAQASDDLR